MTKTYGHSLYSDRKGLSGNVIRVRGSCSRAHQFPQVNRVKNELPTKRLIGFSMLA